MDTRIIIDRQKKTTFYLNKKRLKDALDLLGTMVKETHDSTLIDAQYNIEISYKSLLKYTVEGFTDPERLKIYNQFVSDLFLLADDTFLALKTNFATDLFYTLRKKHLSTDLEETITGIEQKLAMWQLMNEESAPFEEDLNQQIEILFELLMTQPGLYNKKNDINKIFTEGFMPWPQQSIMVTAVTLLLLHHFNTDALLLLFNLTAHPQTEIRQRALTGLLLVLFLYDDRLSYFPAICRRLEVLHETTSPTILQGVIIQLMRTHETEKLAQKLTDEILPEVARIHPNLRNRLDLDNIIGENFMEGKNPDWEDIFSDSPELLNKLEEFSKLQMEGSDLFVSTFRMLKHFSFFHQTSNWFLPFSYPNPTVSQILKDETGPFQNRDIMESLAATGILCNSDKFSLILSIPAMPQAQKDMMGQMFMAEISAASEVEKSDELIDPEKQLLSTSNQYIQDLYRFFRVHPQKADFDDPFNWRLDFHNKKFINYIFPNQELLPALGDYLFKKDRYAESLEVFNLLGQHQQPDIQIIQKQAFCYQQGNNYKQALKYYLEADLFDHQQVWNLKKIALCYRHLNNPEKALEFYKKAEKINPDNLHTQVSIGHCLFELKQYEEALKYYFKVEYLDPKNSKVWRPIVWCALALGKFEQAEKYCLKLLNDQPSQHDYLNMGHLKWCNGHRQEAIEWYQKCVTFPGYSLDEFLETFENDRQLLISHHVDENDIPIMLDQLRYYLQNQ